MSPRFGFLLALLLITITSLAQTRYDLVIKNGTLIGHNSVRRSVMGAAQRDPSPEEQQAMEDSVRKAMEQGAVGFSTGLIYIPGTYSKTPEVVGLAKAASKYGGIYASHIRDEGLKVVD